MNKIYKLNLYFLSAVVLLLTLNSCQKVIDIELAPSDVQVVIQGSLSDQAGPYHVKVTRTVNFNETNDFPPVSGASVSIEDGESSETLTETAPGIYSTSTMIGTPGKTYTLSVKIEGKEYLAKSTMPSPVGIDTLEVGPRLFGEGKVVDVIFQDSAGIENYYRFVEIVNGALRDDLHFFDDELNDGTEVNYTLFQRKAVGDTVIVQLQSIDKGAWEFFRTADQASGDSQSPANPIGNISNGALGYFSAYSVRTDTIVVE